MVRETLQDYRGQVQAELTGNILPFYLNHAVDVHHGGFHGFIAGDLHVPPGAPKGLIQHSRILWTFAQAHRRLNNPAYLALATRAYDYLVDYFWDQIDGGLYWRLEPSGRPQNPVKMVYGQAFGIYAFSEYYLATRNRASLDKAICLYRLVERHSRDSVHGGYFEAFRRDWTGPLDLSVDEAPATKTMNTHLHLLEAYTNLLRAWDDPCLRLALQRLIRLALDHIVDPATGHFKLHFDAAWQPLNDRISYGHDIEGSWLLLEAAEALAAADLLEPVRRTALKMAEATLQEGVDADGGLFNEGDSTGVTDDRKDWWLQAEAMVGFLNAYQLTGQAKFLQASLKAWQFVQKNLIDRRHGEWYWGVTRPGRPYRAEKSSPWKAPYHNGRACLEVMRRITELLNRPPGEK